MKGNLAFVYLAAGSGGSNLGIAIDSGFVRIEVMND